MSRLWPDKWQRGKIRDEQWELPEVLGKKLRALDRAELERRPVEGGLKHKSIGPEGVDKLGERQQRAAGAVGHGGGDLAKVGGLWLSADVAGGQARASKPVKSHAGGEQPRHGAIGTDDAGQPIIPTEIGNFDDDLAQKAAGGGDGYGVGVHEGLRRRGADTFGEGAG